MAFRAAFRLDFSDAPVGEQTDGCLTLRLCGDWRALDLPAIRAELAAVPLDHVREITIDARGAERLDLSGAWLLREFLDTAAAGGVRRTGFVGEVPAQLALIDRTRAGEARAPVSFCRRGRPVGRRRGRSHSVGQLRGLRDGLDFVGRVTVQAARASRSLRRLRPISVARHVYDTGITAIRSSH
jgi:hypothetical protein